MDERRTERLVNLSPQPINVDLYQFGERIKRIVPDMFGDFFAPDNFARVAREVLKQRVLFGSELDHLSLASDSLAPRVYLKIADFDDRRAQLLSAPQQRTQTRQEFTELERLRQIIVGAGVEATDAILHGVARSKH